MQTKPDQYYGGFDSQVNDSWIVILNSQGRLDQALKLPLITVVSYGSHVIDLVQVVKFTEQYPHIKFLAEEVHAWNMGSKGAMTFGSAVNLIGQLQVQPNIEMSLIKPKEWKTAWGLSSDKGLSLTLAKAKRFEYAGKVSHNLAESFLLARFLYEAHQQPQVACA